MPSGTCKCSTRPSWERYFQENEVSCAQLAVEEAELSWFNLEWGAALDRENAAIAAIRENADLLSQSIAFNKELAAKLAAKK